MAPKRNPLKLNKLQLKTLTLLQAIAQQPDMATPDPSSGAVTISGLPHAHGNHFHLGPYLVDGKDATGLRNEAVFAALTRKNLTGGFFPQYITLTGEGVAYETNMADQILRTADH
jgi:hypothetical protein